MMIVDVEFYCAHCGEKTTVHFNPYQYEDQDTINAAVIDWSSKFKTCLRRLNLEPRYLHAVMRGATLFRNEETSNLEPGQWGAFISQDTKYCNKEFDVELLLDFDKWCDSILNIEKSWQVGLRNFGQKGLIELQRAIIEYRDGNNNE